MFYINDLLIKNVSELWRQIFLKDFVILKLLKFNQI